MPPPLDAIIHQPTRLQIMSVLYRNRQVSFTDLRDGLGLTPGNLASHAVRLEDAGYLRSGRVLVDLSFEVNYRLTEAGREAFRAYLAGLQALIDEAREAHDAQGPGADPGLEGARGGGDAGDAGARADPL